MSKKVLVTKKIKKGKFYAVHEGSKHGHPGKCYWKNDNRNLYLFIKTGSSSNKNNVVLVAPIGSEVEQSYVYKRPILAKRRDVGSELPHLKFSKQDKKTIKGISKQPLVTTLSVKRKDQCYMRRLKKKPKI